jgi:hypothetical protein
MCMRVDWSLIVTVYKHRRRVIKYIGGRGCKNKNNNNNKKKKH